MATVRALPIPALIRDASPMEDSTIEEMIEGAFEILPSQEEKRRAACVVGKLSKEERVAITRVVEHEENFGRVAKSLGMETAELERVISSGLAKLCQNGKGVPALCRVVEKAVELKNKRDLALQK